jgi:hypothetical protein
VLASKLLIYVIDDQLTFHVREVSSDIENEFPIYSIEEKWMLNHILRNE